VGNGDNQPEVEVVKRIDQAGFRKEERGAGQEAPVGHEMPDASAAASSSRYVLGQTRSGW